MGRRDSFNYRLFLKRNIRCVFVLIGIFVVLGIFKGDILCTNATIGETIPFYNANEGHARQMKLNSELNGDGIFSREKEGNDEKDDNEVCENTKPNITSLIGPDDITFQPETDVEVETTQLKEIITAGDVEKLKNINYLKSKFYIVDRRTDLLQSDVNAEEFLKRDLTIDNSIPGPKVLILHTHSCEDYQDSDMSKDMSEGIWGVGERLKELLETKYGIECLHDAGRYDMVDGRRKVIGSYERMEPNVKKILKENPSIQLTIDMHRDGVPEGTKLVRTINGKETAQIMFFNGLCRLYKDGNFTSIPNLTNPYIDTNMALSFNMQVAANKMYPSFTRKVYVNAYRYSLHMMPKALLIEVGAQTNTKQEALNAMEPLANILASVILKK